MLEEGPGVIVASRQSRCSGHSHQAQRSQEGPLMVEKEGCPGSQPQAATRKTAGVGKTRTLESDCLSSNLDSTTWGSGTWAIYITEFLHPYL